MANTLKILLIPLDNRPVSYTLPQQIASLNKKIQFLEPPRNFLGGLTEYSQIDKIFEWLEIALKQEKVDYIVVSLDTAAYGGLIPSRRISDSPQKIVERLKVFRQIVENSSTSAKIYGFSSIMRISDSFVNEEEKEYWDKFGKELFRYSFLRHKTRKAVILSDQAEHWGRENLSDGVDVYQTQNNNSSIDRSSRYGFASTEDDIARQEKQELESLQKQIPAEILEDYLKTRERNFSINRFYLKWIEEKFLDFLVFSKDDTGQFGLNVQESEALETEIKEKNLSEYAITLTGADEIPCDLVSRAISSHPELVSESKTLKQVQGDKMKIKIFPVFSTQNGKNVISRYEDKTIQEAASGQIKLCGGEIADSAEDADMILLLHTPEKTQNDHCLRIYAEPENKEAVNFCIDFIKNSKKPLIIGDISCANGGDNLLVMKILDKNLDISKIYGYAGWNTTGNTLGSVISIGISRFIAEKTNNFDINNFKKTLLVRLSDDWAYQTIVRQKIRAITDIADIKTLKEELSPLVLNLAKKLDYSLPLSELYLTFPWSRTFEAEIDI